MKKNKKLSMYVYFAGAVLLLGLIVTVLFFTSSKKVFFADNNRLEKVEEDLCEYRSKLNGVCLLYNETNPQLVAVMIENHVAARPQAGLGAAAVVYEAPVEGHYTRFLALYPIGQAVDKVGPVRSARPYYVDWVQEWGEPLYLHVGGSPDALAQIQARGIHDANQFYFGNYYWRSSDRPAPHNVYTNSENWNKIIKQDNFRWIIVNYPSWNFVTTTLETCVQNCVQKIQVSFLHPDYEPVWQYDAVRKQYIRFQSGMEQRDEQGKIVADTIIIQTVSEKVLDDVGRLALMTIGSGKATVVYDGKRIEGTWKKESITDRTRFYDANGQEIPFKPGKIWIEVVPKNVAVNYE